MELLDNAIQKGQIIYELILTDKKLFMIAYINKIMNDDVKNILISHKRNIKEFKKDIMKSRCISRGVWHIFMRLCKEDYYENEKKFQTFLDGYDQTHLEHVNLQNIGIHFDELKKLYYVYYAYLIDHAFPQLLEKEAHMFKKK